MKFFSRDPRHFGRNHDVDLASLVEVDFPIHASIPIAEVMQVKQQAIACHASQDGNLNRTVKWLQYWFGRHEVFMRAIPEDPLPHLERDLFEGVQL